MLSLIMCDVEDPHSSRSTTPEIEGVVELNTISTTLKDAPLTRWNLGHLKRVQRRRGILVGDSAEERSAMATRRLFGAGSGGDEQRAPNVPATIREEERVES